MVVFGQGFDEEREYQARARWNRFVANIRLSVSIGAVDLTERADVAAIVRELLDTIGRDAVVAMSHEYGHGQRLAQLIEEIVDRVHNLLEDGSNPVSALASFAGDQAVRIMSIHKSKGLEFDTVIVLGVENQTFWGSVEAERSAYFVAVSRAKRRLFLTTCDHRDRPDGVRRWDAQRTEQEEFIGYALGVIV